jgi:Clostripain family
MKKAWTFAVYMAGDNDLDKNAYLDLKEMKRVGSTATVNVVVQLDSASAGSRTTRYEITRGAASSLPKDAKASLGNTDTGDPKSLIDFVTWVAKNYPAERYALVLWNHGEGWDDTDIFERARTATGRLPRSQRMRHAFFRTTVTRAAAATSGPTSLTRAILIDDNAKDFLDDVELQHVARIAARRFGGKIALFGMDACLMNQLEIAYQLRGCADCVVGSELTEPLDGWPYQQVLSRLAAKRTPDAASFAAGIVQDYAASYKGQGVSVTQSAVALKEVAGVAKAVDALAKALITAMRKPDVKEVIQIARLRTVHFDDNLSANVDLGNFCERLDAAPKCPKTVKTAARSVLGALRRYVIRNGTRGSDVANAQGVSIYYPLDKISPLYVKHLDFAKRNAWTKFLRATLA